MKRKPSVRATRRQSSGSDRGRKERTVPWDAFLEVAEAWFEEGMELLQAQERIRELEAQLSKRKGARKVKR